MRSIPKNKQRAAISSMVMQYEDRLPSLSGKEARRLLKEEIPSGVFEESLHKILNDEETHLDAIIYTLSILALRDGIENPRGVGRIRKIHERTPELLPPT